MRTARADLSNATWRKSTYSNGQGGDCVEVVDHVPGTTPVRDSKHPAGPVLLFSDTAWTAFVEGAKGVKAPER